MTTCVPPVNYELPSNEALAKQQTQRNKLSPLQQQPTPPPRGIMSSLKYKMHKGQMEGPCEMDLTYITERIIAMSFTLEGQEATYKNSIRDVAQMLKNKHGDTYRVINLSERRNDMNKLNREVLDFGWPDPLAPPLERLCSICKSIDSWLNSDPRNVVVLHCKGGKGRTGMVIAGYMHYNNICASDDQALDRFAMKRFYDDKIGGVTQPSQRRYVHYFAGLLSGSIKINSSRLYLHHMVIHGIPNFDGRGGCRPYIKVYQGMQPIFVSGVYAVRENTNRICITLDPCLQLKGDILIKCYNKRMRSSMREIIFRCQFHTCAISNNNLKFNKHELDEACTDPRFPDSGGVEFIFSPGKDKLRGYHLIEESAPIESSADPLERWDSYENFKAIPDDITEENGDSDIGLSSSSGIGSHLTPDSRSHLMHVKHHQPGPVDGSLYATVTSRTSKETKTTTTKKTSGTPGLGGAVSNGEPPALQNGPLNHSADSGISSTTSGATGSVNVTSHRNAPTLISADTMATSLAQRNRDEQSQLDEILQDLLSIGDSTFGVNSGTMTKASDPSYPPPSSGSLTTQSGNTRTVVSWQSTQAGPSKSVHVTKSSQSPDSRMQSSAEKFESSYSSSYPGNELSKLPPNAFSYGNIQERRVETKTETVKRERSANPPYMDRVGSPTYRDRVGSPPMRDRVGSPTFRDRVGSPTFSQRVGSPPPLRSSPTSPVHSRMHSSPYKTDYEDAHRGYYSDSEPSYSWLAQQQVKLQAKRGKDPRSPQEKRLVAELKNAQNSLMRRRAQSEADEKAIVEEYAKQDKNVFVQNGPMYAMSSPTAEEQAFYKSASPDLNAWTPNYGDNYKAEKSYFVSGVERPPFTTHQTKYTFSVSPPKSGQPDYTQNSYGANVVSKPPPSPGPLGRSSAPNSPLIPTRGQSSKEALARTRPVKEYQPHGYSPKLDELERSLQQALQAPTPPVRGKPNSGYESDDMMMRRSGRTDSFDSRAESSFTYGSYEGRSMSPEWDTPRKATLDHVDRPPPPPPPQEEEEEDVIMLQPIGPGMQNLEPEVSGEVRSPTPSFPLQSAVTPPFPVTPKTPYENQASPIIARKKQQEQSPVYPMQQQQQHQPPQQQQQQQQHIQQQQHMQQQYMQQQRVQQQQQHTQQQYHTLPAPQQVTPQQGRAASATLQHQQQEPMGSSISSPEYQIRHDSSISQPEYHTLPHHNQQQQQQQQQQQPVMQMGAASMSATMPHQQSRQAVMQTGQFQQSPDGGTTSQSYTVQQQSVQRGYNNTPVMSQPGGLQQQPGGLQQQSFSAQQQNVQKSYTVHQQNNQSGGASIQPVVGVQQQQRVQSPTFAHTQMQGVQAHGTHNQAQPQQQIVQHSVRGEEMGVQSGMQNPYATLQDQRYNQQQQQFSTLQQQQHQQQQHNQQQQHHQQQAMFGQQQMGQQNAQQQYMQNGYAGGTLSVDTSQRSMSNMPRSPSSLGSAHSPPSPGSIQMIRAQLNQSSQSGPITPGAMSMTGQSSPSVYFGQSRRGSLSSLHEGGEIIHHTPRFVRDTSKFWYKPHVTREEAIVMLKDKLPGTFVVRDSNSFPGAFGLAVKVAQVPPNVQTKGGDPMAELVRHFLIEPTPKGVKLKGCSNEPVFGSLAALVYQHSITPLALPCKLNLPELVGQHEVDTVDGKVDSLSSASQLLAQGAACNVLYINSVDTESLTGPQAVSKAIKMTFGADPAPKTTVVHFKVSSQGITLTDNKRKLFFRRFYPVNAVTFCGMDPEERRVFGFVARKTGSSTDNACHLFAEIDLEQPATAIVNFVTKVMIGQGRIMKT